MSYYIEYYKEKDTDPMVFLQRFRCTTEPIGGGTEYDEEGELVSWDAAVAAIEIAMKQLGWHPASELPEVGSICITWCISKNKRTPNGMSYIEMRLYAEDGWHGANINEVKWWCYPPKEY